MKFMEYNMYPCMWLGGVWASVSLSEFVQLDMFITKYKENWVSSAQPFVSTLQSKILVTYETGSHFPLCLQCAKA